MKLLNENKFFNDCIIEAFEESDNNLLDVAEYMKDFITDFFDMDDFDRSLIGKAKIYQKKI